ncbi:MAG: hypothetical protein HY678_08990 [Chloroflexi bacterium]|nr:hypothetical protein [Chloroflexota bacterium]
MTRIEETMIHEAPIELRPPWVRQNRRLLNIAAALAACGGLIAVATGVFFVVGDHPFYRDGGFSEEINMTRTEAEALNPLIVEWTMHVSDQVGTMSAAWGLFVIGLAWFGLRQGQRSAWIMLWVGGLPALLSASFSEYIMFGHMDEGSLLSTAVLVLFMAGMIAPAPLFLRARVGVRARTPDTASPEA